MVERSPEEAGVGGSIPSRGTNRGAINSNNSRRSAEGGHGAGLSTSLGAGPVKLHHGAGKKQIINKFQTKASFYILW